MGAPAQRETKHIVAHPALRKRSEWSFSCEEARNKCLGIGLEPDLKEYVWCILWDIALIQGCSTMLELFGTEEVGVQQFGI